MSPLRLAALAACLLGCSRDLTGSPASDGSADCCPITENPVPGGCVEMGGAASLMGGYCTGMCDGANDFVRTIDAKGCPKLIERACADGSADLAICR